jgi:polysaccharide biosynthesis protein PslH
MANVLVLVSYKVFPAEMGGQKAVTSLYHYLSKHHTVHFAVSADNEPVGGYLVNRILFPHGKMLWNVFKIVHLKRLCRKYRIQLVIAEHSYTGWIAFLLKQLTNIPFLIRSHNIEASRFRQMKRPFWRIYNLYEKWIHKKADHNFFISEEDQATAIKQFGLARAKCDVVPYGINTPKNVVKAREKLAEKFAIHSPEVFYFNGTLDYLPNKVAVENIMEELNPRLQSKGLNYTIIVSGKNLSAELVSRVTNSSNMMYVGFEEDVDLLYQSASVFLNPVMNNSGVKTKVIEALANHCKVVSMSDGATGINTELCGDQLLVAENGNWDDFAEKVMAMLRLPPGKTPGAFFDYFSATNIAQKAADKINFIVDANT